jgi:hypothetical protein
MSIAKTIVAKAFADAAKTKKAKAKKEPLPRKPAQIAASATLTATELHPVDPELAKRDGEMPNIPDSLRFENRKPLTPEQQAKVDAAMSAAPQPVQERQNELRQKQAARKKEASHERIKKLKAKLAGETAAMPLEGKAALRAITEKAVQEHVAHGGTITKLPPKGSAPKAPGKPAKSTSRKPAGKLKGAAKAAKGRATKPQAQKRTKTAPKNGARSRYDWNGAAEAAKKGVIPSAPDFSANTHRYYRPALDEVVSLVKARDLKKLKAHRVHGTCSSPQAIKKYQKLAITALEAK